MEATVASFAHPQFYGRLPERPDVGCVDPRLHELLIRFAGGPYGVTHTAAASMELAAPGSFTDLEIPVPILACIVNEVLEDQTAMHPECVGFEEGVLGGAIHDILENDSDSECLFELTKLLCPAIDPACNQILDNEAYDQFHAGLLAHRRVYNQAAGLEISQEILLSDGSSTHAQGRQAPKRLELSEQHHEATDFVASMIGDLAFRATEARRSGTPAYEATFGAYGSLAERLRANAPFQAITADNFNLQAAIWHAAVIMALERRGGDAIRIHVVTELLPELSKKLVAAAS